MPEDAQETQLLDTEQQTSSATKKSRAWQQSSDTHSSLPLGANLGPHQT